MVQKANRKKAYRRFVSITIALTYVALAGFIVSFEYCKIHGLKLWSEALCIVFLLIFAAGFYLGFIRTGLWRFIHKPLRQMDEKEFEITSRALRIAYTVFALFIISLLLVFSFAGYSPDLVSVIGIFLLAHTLPAAVIGWTKSVED
ncbi:MAG: hypothetical protein PF448_08940 [Bacteroidales bacterium]|jgi:heme/copper-type cytochrome/quinol oxidase subunit 2|nr:hypothetical protein [Bacteroidales bacterium]